MKQAHKLQLPERIETERLLIQRFRVEDAEEIFYCYASKPEATKYVSWPTHESIADTRQYLGFTQAAWNKGTDYSYAIRLKSSQGMIGSVGVVNESGKCNFGYILGPSHWGRGLATEAAGAVLEQLMQQQNVYRLWTLCDEENLASVRVIQKLGLKEEARLRQWMRFPNQDNRPKDCILFKYEL